MCQDNLAGQQGVVVGHVGIGKAQPVFQFDFQPGLEFF